MQEEFEDTPWKGLSESVYRRTDKTMAKVQKDTLTLTYN